MGSVRSLRTKRRPDAVGRDVAPVPSLLAAQAERFRGPFLEALPIAGAIIALEHGRLELIGDNGAFRALGGFGVIERCDFADRLIAFLSGEDPILDLDWIDGDPIVGRHYSVRIARVAVIENVGPRCLLTLMDRTHERATEKNLRLEMFNDSLTGLPNRAGFSDALEPAIAAAEPGSLAVVVLDLLRFSRINESIGSIAGDELLITVARRLLSTMRGGDILARIGGNEFAVCVRVQDGPAEALAVAQRINAVLATPCRLSDLEIRVGCAIGCAVLEEGCDGDEMVRRAQFALKRAKSTGETEIYQPRAFRLACQHFTVETALRRALEAERLTLAYQPVIDLASGRPCGFEALARWKENGDDISPATFVPVAEDSGLILPLGRWALESAVRTLAQWDAATGRADTRVAVNVSSIQIARDDVPRLVGDTLSRYGIAPERLMLEITESAIIAEPERAARTLNEIRETGATLALDDFGTGYSNLAYLQKLPLDVLKIDQSFITGMLGDRDKVAIVRAVLSLADALGIKTTAEGVETLELSRTLAALGCMRGQGFYYSAPLPPEAALAYWSRSKAAAV